MVDISDYEFQSSSGRSMMPEPRPIGLWIAVGVLFVLAIGLGWYFIQNRQAATDGPPAGAGATTAATGKPLGGDAVTIDLPPLDQTDTLVRTLAGGLSSHPLLASWLATDGVIRRFVIVIDNIAYGQPVRKQLTEVAPAGQFRVAGPGSPTRPDLRNYARYEPIAAAMESIDPTRAAQMYTMLRPRIEEAYLELGRGVSFDRALEQAIVALLQAPPIRGDEALVPAKTVGYAFSNPQLESLTPAQKHLLRMGPERAPRVQAKLRDIALALNIPRDRLP
jgi:hypothetical protein